ncbi:MAG: multicopper oxidase domain-containing protein [Geobacteraceae bacterium]|nr:multicopper oxidase domain-containing protein [Geobacteraceae bacterium]
MQFRVSANAPADTSYDPASGIPIRSGAQTIKRLVNTATGTLAAGVTLNKTREITLNEIGGPGGPIEALVNNSKWNGLRLDGSSIPGSTLVLGNYLTELPNEGETELWEIVNLTADAHPIHLHGVQFQIMNRQALDTGAFSAAYNALFQGGVFIPGFGPPLGYAPSAASDMKYGGNPNVDPYLLGAAAPPLSFETGWKDTAIMPSGQVTRIVVRFAPQSKAINNPVPFFDYDPSAAGGYYVWHCHITDHEDNEMMRPYQFQPAAGAIRSYVDF